MGTIQEMIDNMDDITAACNLIERARKKNLENKCKGITIQLFTENNRQVSCVLYCIVIPNGNASFSHCLVYYKKKIFPTTNNRLKCINSAGLKKLYKNRDAVKRWRNSVAENINFSTSAGPNVQIIEQLHYNLKKGTINYSCYFNSKIRMPHIYI